jgi:glycosyltransferase involved in cell wall biosynthesis
MMLPKVSIGLPTYNRPEMLEKAVESIRRQSFSDFELVISDNCSPDPRVFEMCTEWAKADARIRYFRQESNLGPLDNFLWVFNTTRGPLFMWASDDDLWDREFLKRAVDTLSANPSIDAWMCHIAVIDTEGAVVREIPNLARFNSSRRKLFDLAKFIAHPECLGKANLFYSVFRREKLAEAIKTVMPYFDVWGSDMLLLYAFLCRSDIRVDPKVYFSKRLAARELSFIPVVPRKNVVPWEHAGKFYGAMIALSAGTPHHLFTEFGVRARYLYDVLYWRLKLRQFAPWRPSQASR